MILRPLKKKDAPRMLEWMHDPEATRFLPGDFASLTLEDARWFIENSYGQADCLRLAVASDSDEYLGMTSLKHIDPNSRRAELDLVLRTCARGMGAGRFAALGILKEAFDELSLRSVYCDILSENEAALRLFAGLGFLRERVLREKVRLRGTPFDAVRLSMTEEAYRARCGNPAAFLFAGKEKTAKEKR